MKKKPIIAVSPDFIVDTYHFRDAILSHGADKACKALLNEVCKQAIQNADGNVRLAAVALKLPISTLKSRIERHKIKY